MDFHSQVLNCSTGNLTARIEYCRKALRQYNVNGWLAIRSDGKLSLHADRHGALEAIAIGHSAFVYGFRRLSIHVWLFEWVAPTRWRTGARIGKIVQLY